MLNIHAVTVVFFSKTILLDSSLAHCEKEIHYMFFVFSDHKPLKQILSGDKSSIVVGGIANLFD